MRATRAVIALSFLTLATISACEQEDDPAPVTYPECEPGEVRWTFVSPDGEQQGAFPADGGYGFVNALGGDDPGFLTIGSMDGQQLRLEWPTLVANGDSVEARGTLEAGDFSAGNCMTGSFVSILTMDESGDGGTFLLRELSSAPFCEGAALEGHIAGCFREIEP